MTKKKSAQPGTLLLASDEVERAIFVDYEASIRPKSKPTLLGVMVDSGLVAYIVDPLFAKHCANRFKAKPAVAGNHKLTVLQLVKRAAKERRVIVSWSQYDLRLMLAQLVDHPEERALLLEHYRNAIYTSRRWHSKKYPKQKWRNKLAMVAKLLNFKIPEQYGSGLVTDSLELVRKELKLTQSYGALQPETKKAWRTVVKHNQWDLKAMADVLQKQTMYLEKLAAK